MCEKHRECLDHFCERENVLVKRRKYKLICVKKLINRLISVIVVIKMRKEEITKIKKLRGENHGRI